MAKSNAASTMVLCLILVLTSIPVSECVPVVQEEDIPGRTCQVCEMVVKELYCQVQAQISPKKITADEITKIAENTCNLEKEKADCIRKSGTVEQGDKSKLENQEGTCQTLEGICDEVTYWPESLDKPNLRLDGMVHYFCENVTSVCRSKSPSFRKVTSTAFCKPPPKEAEMEKNEAPMEGTPGAPRTNMHSTDGLTNPRGPGEEDVVTPSPSKWGFRRAKESVGAAVEVVKGKFKRVGKWFKGGSKKNSDTGKSEL